MAYALSRYRTQPHVSVANALITALVVAGLVLALARWTTADQLNGRIRDVMAQVSSRAAPDPRIVLCTVTPEDVEDVQRQFGIHWPWPHEVDAMAVETMTAAGAGAIVWNVLHLDRGRSVHEAAPEPGLLLQRLAMEEEEARTLGDAMGKAGNVVLAFALADRSRWESPERTMRAQAGLETKDIDRLIDVAHGPTERTGPSRQAAELPVGGIGRGARLLGFVNVEPDADGVVRQHAVVGRWGERPVLSLAAAAAVVVDAKQDPCFDGAGVRFARERQDLKDGRFLLNPRRDEHRRVAPSQLLTWAAALTAGEGLPAEAKRALEGKIVIWSVVVAPAAGLGLSPMDTSTSNDALLATAIDNLLHGDGRVPASGLANASLLAVVLVLAGLCRALTRKRWFYVVTMFGLAAASLCACYVAFAEGHVAFDLVSPVAGLLLCSAAFPLQSKVASALGVGRVRPQLFLSYRRADAHAVGRIYDGLSARFGKDRIFRDVEDIAAGRDFVAAIHETLCRSGVVLAVVGPDWCRDSADGAGTGIMAAHDPVRQELEAANLLGVPIIPVLVEGTEMPSRDSLPDSLHFFTFRNAVPVRSDPDFEHDMRRLIAVLKSALPKRILARDIALLE